ncbi:aldehyde ferredoxin oxidoreductase C-terminal domain-containing protein [Chloroflexota bacterium]
MKCPKCLFDNREGTRFCRKCVHNLTMSCTFPGNSLECFGLEILAKMLVAACGEKKFGKEDYLWQAAECVHNLERCFNIQEGFTREDDNLPERFYTEPLKGGIRDGEIVRKPDVIIDEYYEARGWDNNGIPTAATLGRLGLQDVEKDIAKFRN